MQSNEIEQFSQLIDEILSPLISSTERKQKEELFSKIRKEDPNKFALYLLNLLKFHQQAHIRSFAAVMLRKNLSTFSEKNFEAIWVRLAPETHETFKKELFTILTNESASNIRHHICDLIAEIAGTIMSIEDTENLISQSAKIWPDVVQNVFSLYESGAPSLIEASLKILSNMYTYTTEELSPYRQQMHGIFKAALDTDNISIKVAGIEALTAFIQMNEPKYCKQMEDLIPTVMNNLIYVLSKDEYEGSEIMGLLMDIVDTEPKFFKKNFTVFFQTMQKISQVKKVEDDGIRQLAIDLVIGVIEKVTSLVKTNEALLKEVLEMIFGHMVNISLEVDEDWLKPPEGFNSENFEDTNQSDTKFGMSCIDRLIGTLGQKRVIPILSQIVYGMLNTTNDWRFRNAALLALSQVGEYVKDLDEISPIVQYIMNFLKDENPKVRYAGYHCIGQMCEDMSPEFQLRFHESVMPALLQGCNDPVPRVQAHALAAMTNFADGVTLKIMLNYAEPCLALCIQRIQPGNISLVRENAMSTIGSIANAVKEYFEPFFESSYLAIYTVFKSITQKELKQLRGMAIEALTLIGLSVGKDKFRPYVNDLVLAMIEIQKGANEELDPEKSYLLSGWQRLCLIFEQEFTKYLDLILPSLFTMVKTVLKPSTSDDGDDDSDAEGDTLENPNYFREVNVEDRKKRVIDESKIKKKEINTYETEDAEVALNMLAIFITQLGQGYITYLEPTVELIMPMLKYHNHEDIRKSAAKCLPGLVDIIVKSNLANKEQVIGNSIRLFVDKLWDAIDDECDPEMILSQVQILKECIDKVGRYMTLDEIKDMSAKILKTLELSDLRKTENQKMKHEEDVEEEEIQTVEEETDNEESLQVELAQLIGTLFKTHKELTLPLVEVLYSNVLSKVLQPGVSEKMHKFGIFLIDDMIEFLGIELIPDKWPSLSEAILSFSTDKNCLVRQAATYGIGVLAEKSKEAFSALADISLKKLLEALAVPRGSDDDDKTYYYCVDNIVSSIGKIIKCCPDQFNLNELLGIWLEHLPIRYDKNEAHIQHEMLVDIILTGNSVLILGENYSRLPKILNIFGKILDTKMCNEKIKSKISTVLKLLINDNAAREIVEKCVSQMSQEHQKRIQETLAMQA